MSDKSAMRAQRSQGASAAILIEALRRVRARWAGRVLDFGRLPDGYLWDLAALEHICVDALFKIALWDLARSWVQPRGSPSVGGATLCSS